jgi:hypothetical protein
VDWSTLEIHIGQLDRLKLRVVQQGIADLPPRGFSIAAVDLDELLRERLAVPESIKKNSTELGLARSASRYFA